MRWKDKEWKIGGTRVIKRFLFFPRCVDGEWRWLETVKIQQQLCADRYHHGLFWEDISWVDEQAQEQEE